MKDHKTTAKEIAYFCQRVRYWIKFLWLSDWRVDVYAEKLEGMSAGVELWWDSHAAHVKINTKLGRYTPSKSWLNKVALHEVLHILLCDFSELCKTRFVSKEQVSKIEHMLIRRLETALTGYDSDA